VRLSTILSVYIGRHFLLSFVAIFMIFMALILVFDLVELLRRASTRQEVPFTTLMEMAILKLPHMGQQTFPFAVLFGGMAAFWRLTRSHELVVARAAGVSAWQFLCPVLLIALLLGLLRIGVLNPMASAMLSKYEQQETALLKGRHSFLSISRTGLWLRQSSKSGQSVVNAKHILQKNANVELHDVTVFVYEGKDKFKERIDADQANLADGFWHLRTAWLTAPEKPPRFESEYWLETNLTLAKIQDSFAPPETMSFWDLPAFINTLENAGFSATRHRLYWHSLLAAPLLMCAMTLIAATFTLRHVRRGGTTYIITGGVLTGFVFYFFSDLVFALGLSDSIPVTLAAWAPSSVTTLLGLAMLLHLEDG